MLKTAFATQNVTQNSAYSSSRADYGDIVGIGSIREDDNGFRYRWVQNQHDSALAAGDVVSHDASDGVDMFKYVTDGVTAQLGFMAGVVTSTSIAKASSDGGSDGGYGWIMISGVYASIKFNCYQTTDIAVGTSLVPADGTVHAAYSTAMGTAPIYSRYIIALETLSSTLTTTTKKGLVCCY